MPGAPPDSPLREVPAAPGADQVSRGPGLEEITPDVCKALSILQAPVNLPLS